MSLCVRSVTSLHRRKNRKVGNSLSARRNGARAWAMMDMMARDSVRDGTRAITGFRRGVSFPLTYPITTLPVSACSTQEPPLRLPRFRTEFTG
jgi:hypothetical protein